jgi:hypothetical protein
MKPELMQRVFKWNERRYDRVFDLALTSSLLHEEWEEWMEADKDVDLLDAMLDVMYVAIGGIWKLNTEDTQQQEMDAAYTVNEILSIRSLQPGYCIVSYIADTELDTVYKLLVIAMLAEAQARMMGLSEEAVHNAFEVVCDSNDSKAVKKTASNVKANIDKGSYFIPPEPRLQEILNARLN